jgi:oligopeptide transport system substrate-binding protein
LLVAGAQLACRPVEAESAQASKVIRVGGEEIVVTRVVPGGIVVPPTPTAASPSGEPAVLDVGRQGEPGIPDPQTATSDNELDLVENLFAGLTRLNHLTGEAEPQLAERWEVSADGLAWTFYLRADIFWVKPGFPETEGFFTTASGPQVYRPVIADDVVFAIQRACDPRVQTHDVLVLFLVQGCEEAQRLTAVTDSDLEKIGVRAINDKTVVIQITEPASYLPSILSMTIVRPVPRELATPFQETGDTWTTPTNIVTSGPFTFGTETGDERTVLQRNPYWPLPFSGTVNSVNLYWLDVAEAYELWLAKGLDVSSMPAAEREDMLPNSRLGPNLRLVSNQAVFYLAFNFDSPVFSDPGVRRAFSAAIDREALLEEVYGGLGVPLRHFLPPGVFGAPPLEEVGVGYNSDRAILEMVDSSLRDCGFLPPIRYMVGSTDLALFHAETVRNMWERELGCPSEKITIEQVHFGELLAKTRPDAGAERPDIWDLGWASYFPDGHNWLGEVLHCNLSENRQNRPCSEADELIAQAATSYDAEQRIARYREAERLFFGESGSMPVAPLLVQAEYLLVQPWLQYTPAHFGGEQFDTYRLDAVVKRLEREQQ